MPDPGTEEDGQELQRYLYDLNEYVENTLRCCKFKDRAGAERTPAVPN